MQNYILPFCLVKRGFVVNNQILTILLIEDDKTACQKLSKYIEKFDDIKLLGITPNAEEGVFMVQSMLPDVVILDIELHGGTGNGIMFLAMLNANNPAKRPYILITTNNSSKVTYETVRNLGADFIMAKAKSDYSAQYVIEFLRMMQHTILNSRSLSVEDLPPENIYEKDTTSYVRKINKELDQIGINPRNIGYRYLSDAILMIMKDSAANVYKQLATDYKKSDASIERAMQNAINRAWRLSSIEDLLSHYTARIHSEKGVPTTLEFVHYYANKIKADM